VTDDSALPSQALSKAEFEAEKILKLALYIWHGLARSSDN